MDTFQTSFYMFVQTGIKCRFAANLGKLTLIDLKKNHTIL